jgi:hypothetical protein
MPPRFKSRVTQAFIGVLFVLLLQIDCQVSGEDVASSASSDSASGCQVCASTGDCDRAYLSTPGKYCGPWLDQLNQRQSCCCPTSATCKLSNYSCRCSSTSSTSSTSSSPGSLGWMGVAIGIALVLSCCFGGCWCFFNVTKRAARPPPQPIQIVKYPMATPIPMQAAGLPAYNVAPMYAHPTAPVYGHPMAPQYGYSSGYGYYGGGADAHHHHHHSSGFSVGLGTVAGLAAGMVIGDAIADAGHHHGFGGGFDGGSGFDGGGGDFGGGDGGGDFGGDF